MNNREVCLAKAREYVCQDRNSTYGDPEDNFQNIATIMSVVNKCPDPVAKVALTAIAVKIARLVKTPSHGDSWIDISGYGACGYDVTQAARDALAALDTAGIKQYPKPEKQLKPKEENSMQMCNCGIWPEGYCDGGCNAKR